MQGDNYWRRLPRARLGRRAVLRGGALSALGAASLSLVGCGDDDDSTPSSGGSPAGSAPAGASASAPAAGAPKKGGEYVVSAATGGQTLDPHTGLNATYWYMPFVADKLISPNRKSIEPLEGVLVENWEQVDAENIVLHVREGVKYAPDHYANGRAFNAEDVVFNLTRIAGKLPEDSSRSGAFLHRDSLRGLDKAVATDANTVKVSLAQANALFLYGMADWHNWPVAKEMVEADPNFQDPVKFAGTGPFMMDKWDPTGTVGHYVRNPNYWRKDQPYFDSVRQVYVPDLPSQTAAFVSKQLSYMYVSSPPLQKTITQGRSDTAIYKWDFVGWTYFRLNQARKPFTDVRVRQAVQLAIDYKALSDATLGEGNWSYTGPVSSKFPGAWTSDEVAKKPGWNPDTKEKDLADAKQLLASAGFENGNGIEFAILPSSNASSASDVPIRIKDQLEKAFSGMKINVTPPADTAEFARRLGQGDYDSTQYVVYPPPDAILMASEEYYSTGSRNYSKFDDEQTDALIDKAFTTIDADERHGIVADLEQRLTDTIFSIPIYLPRLIGAFDPSIQGFDTWAGPGGFGAYDPVFAAYQMSFK